MRTLRIAVDVTPIRDEEAPESAAPFVLELLMRLATARPRHDYRLLTAAHNHETFASYEALGMIRQPVGRGARPIGLRAAGTDLLFCPMTAPTHAEEGVTTLCVLHDLQHLACPWFFDANELARRTRIHEDLAARADHIVCVSEFSRISLIRHLGVPPDRTSVVPIAVHHPLPHVEPDAEWGALAMYSVPRCRFALYPASFVPHKNHKMLLVAFGRFVSEHPECDLHLVLTGELLADGDSIRSAVDRMGLSSRVHVLGPVPDAHMAALFCAASCLVFPSLFEASGMPLIQAMSFGKPILCSREGSLPEVGGDEAISFDARKPETLVEALERFIAHPGDMGHRARLATSRLAAYEMGPVVEPYLDVFARVTSATPERVGAASAERKEDGKLLTPLEVYARYLEAEPVRRTTGLPVEVNVLQSALAVSEADRAARLEVILQQGEENGRLQTLLNDSRFLKARVRTLQAERFSPRRIFARLANRLHRVRVAGSGRGPG
jgi:glycosyltransferase involved in cell wall biosynthesis